MNTTLVIVVIMAAALGFTGGWLWPIIAVVSGCVGLLSMAILEQSGQPADFEAGWVVGFFAGLAGLLYGTCVAIYKASLALGIGV